MNDKLKTIGEFLNLIHGSKPNTDPHNKSIQLEEKALSDQEVTVLREIVKILTTNVPEFEEDIINSEININLKRNIGREAADFLGLKFSKILLESPFNIHSSLIRQFTKFQESTSSVVIPFTPNTRIDYDTLVELSLLWRKLIEFKSYNQADTIFRILEIVASQIGMTIVKREMVDLVPVIYLKAENFPLNFEGFLPFFPIIMNNEHYEFPESLLASIAETVQKLTFRSNASSSISLIIGYKDPPQKPIDEFKGQVIFITEPILKSFLYSGSRRAVIQFFRNNISLAPLNPYFWKKPVMDDQMFFGRKSEISEIIGKRNKDFAITGWRRIGKSSLLFYAQRILENQQETQPILLDCSTCATNQAVIEGLTLEINPRRLKNITVSRFPRMVEVNYTYKQKPFVFLLDETDHLIKMGSGTDWELFKALRRLSNKGIAQTIMTGHRVLFRELKNINSPLYNFVTSMNLGALDQGSAQLLITAPLALLGIAIQPDIISHILNDTARQPQLIQFYCWNLIDMLDKQKTDRSRIDWDDIRSFRTTGSYEEFVLETFEDPKNLSTLEKLIIWLMIEKEKLSGFTIDDVFDALSSKNITTDVDAIVDAIRNLEIANVIIGVRSEEGLTSYKAAVPPFEEFLRKSYPINKMVEKFIKAYNAER